VRFDSNCIIKKYGVFNFIKVRKKRHYEIQCTVGHCAVTTVLFVLFVAFPTVNRLPFSLLCHLCLVVMVTDDAYVS